VLEKAAVLARLRIGLASGLRARVVLFFVVDGVSLPNQARGPRVLDDQALAAKGIFEELPLGRAYAADTDALA
jgi:hypothetical protein